MKLATQRIVRLGFLCVLGLLFLTCALRPALAQSTLPMCFDSTRAAYYPRPTRIGDSLITARRTATTLCIKPLTVRILVRAGDADTTWVQPGGELSVPIVVEAGVGSLQATIGFAASRLVLTDANGNLRMQWISPWQGAANPATRTFNVFNAAGSTAVATVARAYFAVRPTLGRTNVTLTTVTAFDPNGRSITSRLIVRNLVVCVTTVERAAARLC